MDTKIFDVMLDAEEQDLLTSVENDEWETIKNFEQEKSLMQESAHRFLQKNARVNIRMSSHDLMKLKQRAAYKGLPYQTLIASVLHQYAAGHFEEKL